MKSSEAHLSGEGPVMKQLAVTGPDLRTEFTSGGNRVLEGEGKERKRVGGLRKECGIQESGQVKFLIC